MDHVHPADIPNVRVYKLSDGQEIRAAREDPFGLWSISFKRGTIPEMLSGQFTDAYMAEQRIKQWLAQKKRVLQKDK